MGKGNVLCSQLSLKSPSEGLLIYAVFCRVMD
jgi:hypothetical protein